MKKAQDALKKCMTRRKCDMNQLEILSDQAETEDDVSRVDLTESEVSMIVDGIRKETADL